MDIEKIRENFPVTDKLIYFNHAAVAPLPLSTSEKVREFLSDYTSNGCLNYMDWIKYQENTRSLAAKLLGGRPSEIALVKNTSTGISMVAQGLKWRDGDNVIIPEGEFPANAYPWFNLKDRGVEVRIVKERDRRLYPEDFEALIDERTRLISASWVEFATGFMNDIEALGQLCKKHDIYFCVDAIQGLGIFEIDVKACNIDFLAADGHKWLLAPEGIGIFYVSQRVIDNLHPHFVGWHSVDDPSNYLPYHFDKIRKDARKYEEGSPNLLGTYALGASLELLLGMGVKEIGKRILFLTDRLAEGLEERAYKILSPRGCSEKSGILIFSAGSSEKDAGLFEYLGRNDVFAAPRGGGIRFSPHFYNSEEEIKRVFALIDQFKG
ncbi:MAG: aminotransferase class V-fold PLP-dependent enzyme [Deltaproteobacteria bacterium]|nr:aminotransferase class V-fold PLP-dependent enzyme [Deltaproteobacteria bacterium]